MDAIQDISFSHEVINDLVLDPEDNKHLLKALAKRYAQMPHDVDVVATVKNGVTVVETNPDKKIWAGDFVEGKGEGQIILLHGPPGLSLCHPIFTYLLANLLSQVLVRRALLVCVMISTLDTQR
jgi:hypothetical protein